MPRRFLRRGSLLVALLSLIAWSLTLRYTIAGSIGSLGISFNNGVVYFGWWPGAKGLTSYKHGWASLGPRPDDWPFSADRREHMSWSFTFYVTPGAYVAYVPLWCPFLLSTFVFAATARRRHRRGTCSACGYDTTGLNVCPECGHSTTPVK